MFNHNFTLFLQLFFSYTSNRLHISVKKGMLDCVEFMLAENPDLSTIDLQGRTVYHIASSKGDPVMLKKLLDFSRWNLEVNH